MHPSIPILAPFFSQTFIYHQEGHFQSKHDEQTPLSNTRRFYPPVRLSGGTLPMSEHLNIGKGKKALEGVCHGDKLFVGVLPPL